ncbi:MAG: ECF transporter S component [Porphyromonadaceae bacterium]|nr:ECF transporter S component [Porphyromonadaceae bacterium]
METISVKLYRLSYREAKTYGLALLFVAGNLVLPQLFHLLPDGGRMWLPIYFFTLIAAYKYGWKAGLLTALLSPTANALLFGMPAPTALPVLLVKSALLAIAAGWTAARYRKASLLLLAGVVVAYQVVGGLCAWGLQGSFTAAVQDFRMGFPGLLLQLFGGYFCINFLIRK